MSGDFRPYNRLRTDFLTTIDIEKPYGGDSYHAYIRREDALAKVRIGQKKYAIPEKLGQDNLPMAVLILSETRTLVDPLWYGC